MKQVKEQIKGLTLCIKRVIIVTAAAPEVIAQAYLAICFGGTGIIDVIQYEFGRWIFRRLP